MIGATRATLIRRPSMVTHIFAALCALLIFLPGADSRSEEAPLSPHGATLLVRVLVRGNVPKPTTMDVDRDRDT
jgi:hypothetical protein